MAKRREEIDLSLSLEDPIRAREYIAKFEWDIPDPPKYVCTNFDRYIYFDRMTDAEAVFAAHILLRDIQIPMEMRHKNMFVPSEKEH